MLLLYHSNSNVFEIPCLGDEEDVAGNCKSLVSLNVLDTKLTTHGIRLAIQHLPNLMILLCKDSVQAASHIFREGLSISEPSAHDSTLQQTAGSITRQVSLIDLHCTNSIYLEEDDPILLPYVNGALSSAIQLCPFVVNVYICNVPGVSDEDLRALLNLGQLRCLSLQRIRISFDGGILPILEKFGKDSLEFLRLAYLDEVDLPSIVRHCTNLRSLELDDIDQCNGTSSSTHLTSVNVGYQQLRYLESLSFSRFDCPPHGEPTAANLSLLLCNCPSLVSVYLSGLNYLTDQVMEQAAIAHGFSQLEDLHVSFCDQITKISVDLLLLTLECPFKKVSFNYCAHLSRNEEFASGWKEKAEENHWDLSIYRDTDDEYSDDE